MAKEVTPLTDSDPMPFGKWAGTALEHVPAVYLLWMMEQEWAEEKYPELHAYCDSKIDQLEDEAREDRIGKGGPRSQYDRF